MVCTRIMLDNSDPIIKWWIMARIWNDKTKASLSSIDRYVSRLDIPIGPNDSFGLYQVAGANIYSVKCEQCGEIFSCQGAPIMVWIGPNHVLHQECGDKLRGAKSGPKVSRGTAFRCIECSLVRCGEPECCCEECAENMK